MKNLDGIFVLKKSQKKKLFKFWILPVLSGLIIVFCLSFFYFGKVGADYILDNIQPISLFRDGKFLILFQNNAEIRSSGGFIGTFAVADVENFQIKNLNFNTNIHALDRSFTDNYYVEAPEPLKIFLAGKSWAMRDSNYDASFPDAAKDILYFYTAETGDKADGVIALNAKVMVDLLKLTGPINLTKYNLTVSSDNFYDTTQYQIEKEYFLDPENRIINEPKTILKDLYPEIISKALKNKIELAKILKNELIQKEIIFYFDDPFKEQIAQNHNWAGAIPSVQEIKDKFETTQNVDYLYMNSNSYSGDKSSIKINENVDYKISRVTDDSNRLMATLKITRIHTGSYIWPDGPNDTWIRIYVPINSTLISAKINQKDILPQDLTTGKDGDKTFFGYKAFTNPGQVNILEFSYYLSSDINGDSGYHLLVQKQPGVVGEQINVSYLDRILYQGILSKDIQI